MRQTSQGNVALLLKSLVFPAGRQAEGFETWTRASKHEMNCRINYLQPLTFLLSL